MQYSSWRPHTPHELTVLQRKIEVIDRQMDALVYELHGLT